jgi:hypothetical protein
MDVALALLVAGAAAAALETIARPRAPLPLVLAAVVLATDASLLACVLAATAGIVVARGALAAAGRWRMTWLLGADAAASLAGVRAARSSRMVTRMTIIMGAAPLVPGRVVFPLLGASGAPVLPALVGTIIGRVPLVSVATWLIAAPLALIFSPDTHGAIAAGIMAAAWLALSARNTRQSARAHGRSAWVRSVLLEDVRPSRDYSDADIIDVEILAEERAEDQTTDSPQHDHRPRMDPGERGNDHP